MIGYIYKLECEKTKNIYYGSTFDIKKRQNKKWDNTSCKNFINPKLEIIKKINVNNKKELLLIENEYILNNNCINKNVAIQTKETYKNYHKNYRLNNINSIHNNEEKYRKKNLIPIKCNLCDCLTSKIHIKRHQKSNKCINTYKILW